MEDIPLLCTVPFFNVFLVFFHASVGTTKLLFLLDFFMELVLEFVCLSLLHISLRFLLYISGLLCYQDRGCIGWLVICLVVLWVGFFSGITDGEFFFSQYVYQVFMHFMSIGKMGSKV